MKYRIKSMCGFNKVGDKISCRVLVRDGDKALVYLPKNKEDCGCFVICKVVNNCWEEISKDAWINKITTYNGFCDILNKLNK